MKSIGAIWNTAFSHFDGDRLISNRDSLSFQLDSRAMVPNSRVRSSVHPLGDLSRTERARSASLALDEQQEQQETRIDAPADKNSLESDSIPPPPPSADSNDSFKDVLNGEDDHVQGRRLLSPSASQSQVPVVESQAVDVGEGNKADKAKEGWWARLKDIGLAQLTYVGLGMMGVSLSLCQLPTSYARLIRLVDSFVCLL